MKKRFITGIIIVLLLVITLIFYWGYIPTSTLKSEVQQKTESEILDICGNRYTQYPGLDWPFPLFSPDSKYYLDLNDTKFRQAKNLQLYNSNSNKLIGTYSYHDIAVYCWVPDSSGVYIANYDRGDSSLFLIFSRPGRTGSVKKILIPQN